MRLISSAFKIGTKIKFKQGYSILCHMRFSSGFNTSPNVPANVKEHPFPHYKEGEAFIVGQKIAVMREYKLHQASGYEESYVPAYANGKREVCLICIPDILHFQPFLVRQCDVIGVI